MDNSEIFDTFLFMSPEKIEIFVKNKEEKYIDLIKKKLYLFLCVIL